MVREVGDNIWQVSGDANGASLLVIGGIHGNETTGIEAVRGLRTSFENGTRTLTRGTLTLVLGNPGAIKSGTRWIEERDLNRYFTKEHLEGASDGSAESKRARDIARLIREHDVVLDIHATNKPSVPFISSRIDEAHERIYRWLSAAHVLEDPNYILAGEPATVDEYADIVGKVGICFETGQAGDLAHLESVIRSIDAILVHQGLMEAVEEYEPHAIAETYTLTEAIMLDERGFSFADGVSGYSFEPISKGQVIGLQGNESLRAPYDGVIVFPKLPEHHILGKPVCYIAKRI